jgi:hypothetical protein
MLTSYFCTGRSAEASGKIITSKLDIDFSTKHKAIMLINKMFDYSRAA